MNTSNETNLNPEKRVIDISIKLVVVFLLIAWCLLIILPFISPLLWGSIMAITMYPLYSRLTKFFRGRRVLSSSIITGIMLVLIIIPVLWLISMIADEAGELVDGFQKGTLVIPQPNAKVATWPVIGEPIYNFWLNLNNNMVEMAQKYQDKLISFGQEILGSILGLTTNIIMFILSVIILGVLLVATKQTESSFRLYANKLIGKGGEDFLILIVQTIRNVAKGILGVAFIQFILIAIAFMLADVPMAGIWAFLVFFLAIIQLPPTIVTIPVIIYIFSVKETVPAILWTVLFFTITFSDNVLKPWLMGKGAPVPMLVIFIGTLGGFILSGFIGLFTGAIVLSIGYKLLGMWIKEESGAEIIETAENKQNLEVQEVKEPAK
ncbi:MAG: AI-2E family transporter [Bacteroidales bacterium]